MLFDAKSRPELGPVPELVRADPGLIVEANGREVSVVGLFEMGTSFGIDGSLVTSDTNFLRLFPNHDRGDIELGLVHLRPGADKEKVRDTLRTLLPKDVLVMTRGTSSRGKLRIGMPPHPSVMSSRLVL